MGKITDILMYLRYYKKKIFLRFLYIFKGLDYTGRIESGVEGINGYEGCYPVSFLLDQLKPTKGDSILDVGCGKGLFLYYAKRYPFWNIDGIDYSEELTDVAKINLSKIGDSRLHVYKCDFRDYTHLDDYTFYFINNPFGRELIEELVNCLIVSLSNNPRTIKIIYQFPFCLDVFTDAGFKLVYNKFPNSLLIISKD